jgi:hypothetical protein
MHRLFVDREWQLSGAKAQNPSWPAAARLKSRPFKANPAVDYEAAALKQIK